MKGYKTIAAGALVAGLAMTGAAKAQNLDAEGRNLDNEQVFVDGGSVIGANGQVITDASPGDADELFTIEQSATLSADKWYNLNARVVVMPGATLTIEPGTVFGSGKTVDGASGSLIIARGAQIIAEGTREEPIIFTSREDLGNWENDPSHATGKDPRNRGQWRPGIFEWGSVAILGDARISDTRQNTSNPTAIDELKEAPIEGLPNLTGNVNFYGGLNDYDDSGVMRYVSLSYGGDDFDPTTDSELNGMSWGGVGRGFDASHIEIFNNVDDGLEIFGGAANIKNLLVWNIGDDSLDVDQGWRGKVQFLLIVQGAAEEAPQGSGFGDNGIEADGTDGDASGQPVTASSIWNATIIGAPDITGDGSSDRLIALRDNANLQIWNSIFMTDGENALNNDGDDGDGSTGYGSNGTLTFAERWNQTADWYLNPANFPNAGSATSTELEDIYNTLDPTANLLQISGSVWYELNNPGELVNVGVLPGTSVGSENVGLDNLVTGNSPIVNIVRATSPADLPFLVTESDGNSVMGNVMSIDPRAAGDALESNRPMMFQPPNDGFYNTPTNFRGAVAPESNWLLDWTGMSAIENLDGDKILQSPANPAEPTGLAIEVVPTISFQSEAGVTYEIVAVHPDGSQRVVATVEGDGSVMNVADFVDLNASQKYLVKVATL